MSSPKPTNSSSSSLPSWPIIPMPLSLQQQLEQDQRRRLLDSNSAETIVTTLHDRDVLLGRGASSDRFAGNVAFRAMIRAKKADYTAAPTRHKKRIAEEIVDAIEAAGGRFLRRRTGETTKSTKPSGSKREDAADDNNNNDSHDDNHLPTWSVATYEVAVEKVKQALRDTSEKKKGTASSATAGSAGNAASLPIPLQDEAAAAASAALSLAHFGQGEYAVCPANTSMLSINPPAARRDVETETDHGRGLLDGHVSFAPWNTERYNQQQTQQQQQQQPQQPLQQHHVDEIALIRDLLAMRAARAAAATAATGYSSSTLGFPNSTSTAHSHTTHPFESTAAAPQGWYPNRHDEKGDAFHASLPTLARQQWLPNSNNPRIDSMPSSHLWSATASTASTASTTAAPRSTCPESFTSSSSLVHSALLELQQRRRLQEEEDQQQLRMRQEMSPERPAAPAPAVLAAFPPLLPNGSFTEKAALPDGGGGGGGGAMTTTTTTAEAAMAAPMTTMSTDNVEPLDASTTLQVLATWREIPGNYIHMLSSATSPTTAAATAPPFTSRDWQIVRLVQALAESHENATCLEQVHLLMDVVARLPSSQRQLPPGQVHELVQALVRVDNDNAGSSVPPGRGDAH